MRTRNILIILTGLMFLTFAGCEDKIDPLVTELNLDRALSPTGLTAEIRNLTTVQLEWSTRADADHYVVEFSEDSLEFNSIVRELTVMPDEIPVQETFFGDTRYSARVKAISAAGVDDSKWSAVTFRTDPENILNPLSNDDVGISEVVITWPAGEEATRFILTPGNIEHTITPDEMENGEAVITGLSGYTQYDLKMLAGNSERGSASFRTLVDPQGPNAIEVFSSDDLSAVIAGAAPGSTLVLHPGDYTAYTGLLSLDKSLTIQGFKPYEKPMVHIAFDVAGTATDVNLIDLDMNGDGALNTTFNLATAGVTYNAITMYGCNIHDFGRQLIYGNVASKLNTFSIDNCIVSNFAAGGGDFIDFRPAYVASISITNSTFSNSPSARDFIRTDPAATFTGTGLTTTVLIDHCTFFAVSNSQDRILYVRFGDNASTVSNCIFAGTDAYYTNQPSTTQPVWLNNNYFNASGFITAGYVTNAKHDDSGTHTTLDPGFADTASGDFTVSNQTLIDDKIGDPRWLQ